MIKKLFIQCFPNCDQQDARDDNNKDYNSTSMGIVLNCVHKNLQSMHGGHNRVVIPMKYSTNMEILFLILT